jgi:PAS domain S-box-containing protein
MSGATVMVFLLAVVTSYLTTHFQHGLTLMAIQSGSYIITLQVFVAVAALVGLVPTIVLSERNRALARVGAGEAQLRATLETTPTVAVQWFDLAGRVKYWNRASEIFYGWTAAEAMGRTLDELIFTKEQADGFAVALAQIEKSGQPIGPVEFTFRHRDGHSGVLLSTVFQIPHSSGEPRFVCMDVDVTERKFEEEINRTQMMVLEMISAGQPMPETLDALLRRVETQAPDTSASILLTTEDRGHLRHGAAPSLPVEYVKALGEFAIGPEMGSCGTAAWRREPVYVADIDTDPLWASFKQIVLPHGLKACWSAPILDGRKNVLGTLAVYHRQPGLPDEHQIRLLQMATHTAAVCIGKDFAERERRESLVREQQARANYTAQLIAGQEAERKRIAAEIHDSLGQNLSLIKNLAQIALRSQNPASSYEHLAAISNLAQQCISEARELSRELHPYQIEHLGLKRSLELLLENIAQASAEMKFQWKFDDVAEILSSESSTNLYRVVQESLNNALKHSRAQNVSVTLERDIHELQIIIRDDGCGFAAGENPPGMGLRNISERVRMLGGRLTITSSPGNGTRLEAVIPVADVEEVSGGEII